MTEIEQFLAKQQRRRCERLAANITQAQCDQNRKRPPDIKNDIPIIHACKGCPGLDTTKEIAMAKPENRTCTEPGCDKWKVIGDKCTRHAKAATGKKPAKKGAKLPKAETISSKTVEQAPAPAPAAIESAQIKPAPEPTPAQAAKTAGKNSENKCFFCAEPPGTPVNSVGHIKIQDPDGHTRNIYVCHYCSSESLGDLLNAETDKGKLSIKLGLLMYQRALDSRA